MDMNFGVTSIWTQCSYYGTLIGSDMLLANGTITSDISVI